MGTRVAPVAARGESSEEASVREEVRVRLSHHDQQRVAALAARYGWSGLALTVWLMSGELDGFPVEDLLAQCELVARVVAGPAHDPTVRHRDGVTFTVAVADVAETTLIPPVPGKATSTLIVSSSHRLATGERPALDV